MQKSLLTCCLVALVLSLLGLDAQAQNFELHESTLSSAGGTANVGSYQLTSAAGQPSPAGRAQSGSFLLFSGYPSPFFGLVAVRVEHTSPSEAQPLGEAVAVTAEIEALQAPLEDVVLRYRSGGATSYEEVPMEADNGTYQASIPGEAVTEEGIAYRIVATDRAGNRVQSPALGTFSFPIRVDAPGLASTRSLPSGDTESAYRLISVPIRLDNQDPSDVLGDDVPSLASSGSYDESEARFFEVRSDSRAEFPGTRDMVPGRAFWLIMRDGLESFTTGAGEVLALNRPVEIELEQGWNYVANPFNFPIPVDNLDLDNGEEVVLRAYNGSYNDPSSPITTMEPFTGYAVFTEEDDNTLSIDPDIASETANDATPAVAARTTAPELSWSIRIVARSGTSRDANNLAAVMPGTLQEKDALDWPDPPNPFSALSAYFSHPEWGSSTDRFSSDIRPEPQQGAVWPFNVEADEKATLTFEGIASVPESFQVWLVDTDLEMAQDLRETTRYEIPALGGATRSLQLVVGTSDFAREQLGAAGVLPEAFELSEAFPNPSSRGTNLRFGVPEDARVTVRIYNILGQNVHTLLDEERRTAGYHILQWDGRNGRGVPVASGMYLMRVQAEDFTATRKVMIVR